ncbi:MAG: hypothetical protein AAB929_04380 [Patescibacteria group bacterium]
MKSFIFITTEGYTYQPDSVSAEPDIENCQVVGFGRGENMDEAFKAMLEDGKYLLDTSFNEIIGIEIKDEEKKYYFLNDFKPRIKSKTA